MKQEKRIQQIIPAENWWAYYNAKGDEDTPLGRIVVDRLVCWALVSEDGSQGIEGMTKAGGYIDTAENVSNFMGYVYALNKQEAMKALS